MRDTCVSPHFTDPHLAWERERQEILPKIDALYHVPFDRRTDEVEQQISALRDAEYQLMIRIETTPAVTIEGALCQIEAPDVEQVRCGLDWEDEQDRRAIVGRLMAVGTIRRLLAEAGR
ncbi:MAG: hypothetical protein AAF637_24275 [Pseudomonadota bacterium]